MKFGVDFILYHKSPSLVHGKHCIVICKFTYEEGEEEKEKKKENYNDENYYNRNDLSKYDGYEEIIYNNKKYVVKFPIINYKKIINLSRLCESVSKKLILVEYNSKNDEIQSLEISRFSC
ncbi:Uncharacterized protein cmbei_4001260 [Cryptosporidium meleagridis]